ncbi:MAG: hypothetical protein HN758_11180 [Verrucomicrobia bacterium]|jgi:hypothetical protein|nr:hypothetical protein [Verrucomicrobiota bacterium]MBT5063107.1 hypothetical protein [Verrucomicrobiota bacterium]MBT5480385.1 hypothetical protein [Verrucomicrobiota bacterium]MBT7874981.1 hypothetical protein [Verrucomicrobiota bacterium]
MKKTLLALACAMALVVGYQSSVFADSVEVTLSGTGSCAKCKLKQTDACQNALKSGDTLYLLEHNAVSKAFHKNLCSGTANITAVGSVKDVEGKKVLVATKISLAGDVAKSEVAEKKSSGDQTFKGTGVCTKCISKLTSACQNGIIVDGKLHLLEHNDVSKAYHEKVCQKSTPTVVYGKLTEVGGVKKITASKIEEVSGKQSKVDTGKKKVPASLTIKGTGSCLKCALKKSDTCQNALTTTINGKEKLYVFAKNECSNGFHKNLCSAQAEIVAVGTLAEEGDQSIFTPTSLKLQEKKTLTGEALCLKCELKQARTCQNAIRVSVDGKDLIYALDQNKVSRSFHSKVCQSTVAVVAQGTIADINGKLEFTASEISVK